MALTTMISVIGSMKNQTNTSLMTMRVEVAISDKGCHEKSYLEEQRNNDIGSQGAKSPMRRSGLVPGSDQNIKAVFYQHDKTFSANEKQFCIILRKNSIRLWLPIVFHFGTKNNGVSPISLTKSL